MNDHSATLPIPETCTNRDLGSRLRLVRAELYGEAGGDYLARLIGVPGRSWANFEAGVATPGPIVLMFLVLTQVEPSWLLTGAGPRYRVNRSGVRPEPPFSHEVA